MREPAAIRTLPRPARARGAIVLLGLAWVADAVAEFHVWNGADGRKHVSSLPAHAFRPDGSIRPAHDPRSIVHQHARLRERLVREAEALAREALAAGEERPAGRVDRTLGLDDLIALEKRGGRAARADKGQGDPAAGAK